MSGHSKWSTIKRKKGEKDGARAKVFTRTPRPDRYRAFWNTTPAAWSAPNSCSRRRWATPTMSRSGGSCTISTRS